MPLATNTRLGRYEIRSLLGVGGMGEVYLAQDTTLQRLAALKLLPADVTAIKERLHRFEREAYAASSLNHPNILTIYEIGVEDGYHFIAAEFIEGESLRQHIERAPMELREVLDVGIQVASALAAAHAAGVVHRDVKPENIMLRKDGIVKVLDFGLAKLIEQEAPAAIDTKAPTIALINTEAGTVMGTVSYMSPEQTRGTARVDERTDIWSLGVVLYEMIAGRPPFAGQTKSDVIAAILKTEPPVLTRYVPDVPAELERIVTKALRKDGEERYQVVKDLGLDLKSLKQRLEFEAELERTETPERKSKPGQAVTGEDGASAGTMPIAAAQTSPASDIHATSNAEYIVGEIKQHKRGAMLALATLLLAIAGLVYFFYFGGSGKAVIDSVAVLPFTNMTNDPDAEYLSDGLSESLINSLSQLPQLKVIARSSTFKYKGREIDVQEVAAALGVQAIVTGRIVQRGDQLQISVEMVNARDKTQMWGEQYNRKATDLLAVQSEISREIAERLRLKLTTAEQQRLAKRETVNPQAYELLLKARFIIDRGGPENRKKSIEYLNQAIALDPAYAPAYAELSGMYWGLVYDSFLDPKEGMPKAEAAARRALELDDGLAEAHLALAAIKRNDWDWAAAEREYQRAIELNRNLAIAHHEYADHLSIMGRQEQAIAEIKRARELDPLSLDANLGVGVRLYFARQYDQAIEVLKKTLELDENFTPPYVFLGYAYAAKGMYPEAIAWYQKFIKLSGDDSSMEIYLGAAYAQAGQREKAQAILKRLQTTKDYVSPGELAVLYVALGEREQAFASLERAYAAHDIQLESLGIDPSFDPLRSDPRFQDLMRRVGLTP